jgi:uncharacterized protein (TIGR03032 family)
MGAILSQALGTDALLVSSHSENKVFSYQADTWSSVDINNARGLAIGQQYVVVASHTGLYYYDKATGNRVAVLDVPNTDSHEIGFAADDSVIACASYQSALTRHAFGVNEVVWTVPGVTVGTSDARSWVNGVATVNGLPKYVTALGISDVAQGWRDEAKAERGALIDAQINQVVLHDLFFPHSPTIVGNSVYFANSGHGQLCKWSGGDTAATVVATLSGWTRGIVQLGDYLLVGISQGRMTAFPEITTDAMAQPGIAVIELATGTQVEFLPMDVQEIFDIKVVGEGLK